VLNRSFMNETERLRELHARACAVTGPSPGVALLLDEGAVLARASFGVNDETARAYEQALLRARARVGLATVSGRRVVLAVSPHARLALEPARGLPRHRRWALARIVADAVPRDALVRAALEAMRRPGSEVLDEDADWTVVERFEADDRRYVVARLAGSSALSPRERDILARITSGQASKLIAIDLGVSEQTVATHVARIRAKLGVATRIDLIRTFAGAAAHASAS
jgi:DNA-binding CsgD family transcriptional regulator